MALKDTLDRMTNVSQKIKEKDFLTLTDKHRQAIVAMADLEKTIQGLLRENLPFKTIFFSLFCCWLMLEAPLRGVSEKQIQSQLLSLKKVIGRILDIIEDLLDSLPDHTPTDEMMTDLNKRINALKRCLSEGALDRSIPEDELIKKGPIIHERILMVTSNLLQKSFHPEIVSNVLFDSWLRLSTLYDNVRKESYQKMEHYFSEMMVSVRKEVPLLFQQM